MSNRENPTTQQCPENRRDREFAVGMIGIVGVGSSFFLSAALWNYSSIWSRGVLYGGLFLTLILAVLVERRLSNPKGGSCE